MNMRLAEALNWITGAIYSPFEAIRYKHMRHHVDRSCGVSSASRFLCVLDVYIADISNVLFVRLSNKLAGIEVYGRLSAYLSAS